jgi:LmbE family N-acetylglucosaminyl deacetylase
MKMISINLARGEATKILCLGAHCDDIEIGCGATLLRWLQEFELASICWVVFSSTPQREQEARASAGRFLENAGERRVIIKDFRDGFFPYDGAEIKGFFEQLKREFSADLIFTHFRNDLHQDHRLISELTWNTFRDHLIFEYEIPKYDGDLGSPNVFVHLDDSLCAKKIEYIVDCFRTQSNHHWFTEDLFRSLMRIRGVECNAPAGFAEGFYCRKMSLEIPNSFAKP